MRYWLVRFLFIAALFFPYAAIAQPPSPPGQPASGPGGSDYAYPDIKITHYGQGDLEYWIFEPKSAKKPLPVIVFNHGWTAMNPAIYGHWITHIVRKGNLVIYPRWQGNLRTSPKIVTGNAINAVKLALGELQRPGHVKADLTKFAVVGHSIGGIISANMAARANKEGLPQVRAIMAVDPGKTWGNPMGARSRISLDDLSTIPHNALLLILVGAEDFVASERDAKTIFHAAPTDKSNKNYIIVNSDRHGMPPIIASHNAPAAIGAPWRNESIRINVNTLDYFAYWKLFDALTDAAFYGKNRNVALGNTKEQRYMGKWSDGKPVTPLTVIIEP